VRYYTAQLQYNFGLCAFPTDPEQGVYSDCKIAGGSSIVFEYMTGEPIRTPWSTSTNKSAPPPALPLDRNIILIAT
jgi:hypothetical protein